jgi:hypothetical protein
MMGLLRTMADFIINGAESFGYVATVLVGQSGYSSFQKCYCVNILWYTNNYYIYFILI